MNQANGTGLTIKTDKDGQYQFSALDPGAYSIEIRKTGFQARSVRDVDVKATEESTISATLYVKDIDVNFDVHEVTPGTTLNKNDATIQTNLRNHTLDFIPMGTTSLVPSGSRNFARFALLAPGITRVLGQNEFAANGHRGRDNAFLVDGVWNMDNTVTLPALLAPPEAVQELLIQVVPFSAEFGGKVGAQVNAITKSGSNNYHGELWEFYRGSALEPLSLQSRRAGLTSSPRLVDNQFGASAGGPIIRNKTFFFGAFEGNRQRQAPKPFGSVTIPTAAGLASLSAVPLRTAGGTVPAQTPESRQTMIDQLSFLNSVYPQISRYDSLSTMTVNSTPIEVGTYNPLIPQNQNLWYGLVRLDHQLSSKDRLSYRVHIDNRDSPLSTGNLAFGELWGADSKYFAQNHSLSYTRTVNQSLVNEFRFAYTRLDPSFIERDPVSPTVTLSGLFTIGGSASFPQERREQSYQLQDVVSYNVNRHSFKFGMDLNRINLFNNAAPNSKGTWLFSNLQTFMNNQPTSLTQLVSSASTFTFNQLKQSYFVQDDIRLRPSLTVNLGLRYETTSIPLGYFGATDPIVLAAGVQGEVKRDTNNWAPRVGFAYSPAHSDGILGKVLGGGKGSVRGGFGVGYDVLFYALLGNPAANYPRSNTQVTNSGLSDVFPTLAPKTSVPVFSAGSQFVNIPSDAQNPTSNYWSLSVQRELKDSIVVEVGYSGNRSYHLIRQGQANPGITSQAKADAVIAGCTATNLSSCQEPAGFPQSVSRLDTTIGSRVLLETTGQSTYNAGYIQVSKRSSFGLQFGANYTWSANISDSEEYANDISSVDGGIAGSSPQVPQNFMDRRREKARSAFDRPQRLTFHESYSIPFFSDAPKALRHVFANWQVSAFTEIQSGQPFTITVGTDTLGAGTLTPGRPDLNPGGILLYDPTTQNLRTFTIPLDGTGIVTAPHVTDPVTNKVTFLKNSMPTGGTLARNSLRGPGFSNTNLSLMKRITLNGERSLELRGDFINVFNHDNFPNPDGNMSHTTFGKQVFMPLTDARQVLLGVKIRF
jgi:hypothetical protein